MIVDRWNDWMDPEDRLKDIKSRFEDDCPDAERVHTFLLRVTPTFGCWLHSQPRIREACMSFSAGIICDNIRIGTLRGDSSRRARLTAIADTGREIPVAVIAIG